MSFWGQPKKKMPTPPWHGHLLRGITEMSRKLRTTERSGCLRYALIGCMCRAKQASLEDLWFQHFTALWVFRTVENSSIYPPIVKILPA
jgi:hypothetical protein